MRYSISSNEVENPFTTPHIVSQTPITVPQSPEQSLESFRLPKGYRVELVASEPMITEPVAIAWDGNGRNECRPDGHVYANYRCQGSG